MLHSICQQIWKTQQWPQDWKRSVFIPIPKKGNAKECSDYHTIVLTSYVDMVMLKILQAVFQQYVNWELSDIHARFRKGRGTRDQITNFRWITEKERKFQGKETCISASLTMIKALTMWITTNCEKFLKRWEQLTTCLLRNLYAGQEATVRTGHETMDWFKIKKGVPQGCILSLCIFNFYAEYKMQNVRLDATQAGIKIVRRIINNLRYTNDTTLVVTHSSILAWRIPWTEEPGRLKSMGLQ